MSLYFFFSTDRDTYHMLIVHYCRRGEIVEARNVLQTMIEKGFAANSMIMNTLILGYGEAGYAY